MKALIAILGVLAGVAVCQGRIISVDDDGPADFNSIQAAIDDANDGDTVSVAAGTYNESIVMKDGVVVRGAGADVTTIDGGRTGHVVTFILVSGTISGFTITGSFLTDHYAGIYVYASLVNIADNTITANQKAIRVFGNSSALINANEVIDNSDGMRIEDSSVIISNNVVARNGPWACGIDCRGGSATIINNTITHHNWFGLCCSTPASTINIANNIITQNAYGIVANGWLCSGCSAVGYLDISYNDVWGNSLYDYFQSYGDPEWGYFGPFGPRPGTGEISVDPLFADPDSGDYHLKSQAGRWDANDGRWTKDEVTSPCIDRGDPSSDWTGELWPHGKRINMGAYGGTPEASMSLSGAGNIADMNRDGRVDCRDVNIITRLWLVEEPLLREDLDRDGFVSLRDIAILGRNWALQE